MRPAVAFPATSCEAGRNHARMHVIATLFGFVFVQNEPPGGGQRYFGAGTASAHLPELKNEIHFYTIP